MRRAEDPCAGGAARDEAGSALIEMALCASVVLLVIFGIMGCSLAVYTEHYVESAAADGARYASVRGSTYSGTPCASTSSYYCEADSTAIQNYIRANASPGIIAANISVTATESGTSNGTAACDNAQGNDSPGCLVTVTVAYPFTFILPAPWNQSITLKAMHSTVVSQ